jgi:CheY-like chemotaxis protein
MGIPICVRLGELMGGSVTLADRDDAPGARFTLRLPLAYQPTPARLVAAGASSKGLRSHSPGPRALAPALIAETRQLTMTTETIITSSATRDIRGTRVLAVDDSPANLRFMVFVLKRLGCIVATCSDGDQVVAALGAAAAAGAPYDVVVMDLYMVRMNGDAALTAARDEGHTLPVVLCTANATSADVERYRAMGFCGLLGKPFSAEQMHATIARAFDVIVHV